MLFFWQCDCPFVHRERIRSLSNHRGPRRKKKQPKWIRAYDSHSVEFTTQKRCALFTLRRSCGLSYCSQPSYPNAGTMTLAYFFCFSCWSKQECGNMGYSLPFSTKHTARRAYEKPVICECDGNLANYQTTFSRFLPVNSKVITFSNWYHDGIGTVDVNTIEFAHHSPTVCLP